MENETENLATTKILDSKKVEDVIEIIEMLKSLSDQSRYRTMGYIDALRTFGEQTPRAMR